MSRWHVDAQCHLEPILGPKMVAKWAPKCSEIGPETALKVRTGRFSVLRGKETGSEQIVTRRLTTLPNGQGVGGLDKRPSSKVFGASCITCIRSRTKSRPNDEQRTLLVLLIADLWPLWNEALQQRLSGACHRPSAVDAFPGQA